jgi:hypothetical protein
LLTFTFTLPGELRPLAFANQEQVYEQLMHCSWQTLRQFSENDPQLQGTPGAISVLHTHSRRLEYRDASRRAQSQRAALANKEHATE